MSGEIAGIAIGFLAGGIILIVLFTVFVAICVHYIRKSQ